MKKILFAIAAVFIVLTSFSAFALTVNCREHDDRYDKVTFTLSGKKATVHHIKSNTTFNVNLIGKMGNYDVYETPLANLNRGKAIFLYNSKSNRAHLNIIALGFGDSIHSDDEDDLMCR